MKKILPLMIAAALASPVAMAHQAGDILVRGGLAFVSPQTSSDDVLQIDSNMQLGLRARSRTFFDQEKQV